MNHFLLFRDFGGNYCGFTPLWLRDNSDAHTTTIVAIHTAPEPKCHIFTIMYFIRGLRIIITTMIILKAKVIHKNVEYQYVNWPV